MKRTRRWLLAWLGVSLLGASRCGSDSDPLPPVRPGDPDSLLSNPPVILE